MTDTLDATKPEDMRTLARQIEAIAEMYPVNFAAFVTDFGLMRAEWQVRFALWICKRRTGSSLAGWQVLERKPPGIAMKLVRATARHVRYGTDHSTINTVGGFNQTEVNQTQAWLDAVTEL